MSFLRFDVCPLPDALIKMLSFSLSVSDHMIFEKLFKFVNQSDSFIKIYYQKKKKIIKD
jgi:hypothetical protein